MQDGRVEETRVVEKEDDVRQALTRFARLPLFSTTLLEANAEYSVRVKAETRPRNGRFFWPWDSHGGVSGCEVHVSTLE